MKSETFKAGTVGEMVALLQTFPPEYRLDFNPGEAEDITDTAVIETLEGTTSDGPGTVWIQLIEGWRG